MMTGQQLSAEEVEELQEGPLSSLWVRLSRMLAALQVHAVRTPGPVRVNLKAARELVSRGPRKLPERDNPGEHGPSWRQFKSA